MKPHEYAFSNIDTTFIDKVLQQYIHQAHIDKPHETLIFQTTLHQKIVHIAWVAREGARHLLVVDIAAPVHESRHRWLGAAAAFSPLHLQKNMRQ